MSFGYWKIVTNAFPYDLIAGRHDMILPLRHVTENELTEEELVELKEIKWREGGQSRLNSKKCVVILYKGPAFILYRE